MKTNTSTSKIFFEEVLSIPKDPLIHKVKKMHKRVHKKWKKRTTEIETMKNRTRPF